MKKCTCCGQYKREIDFKKDSRTKTGLASICKKCAAVKSKLFYKENTPEYDAVKRREKIVKVYGLTLDDYDEMYEQQEGRCKICGIEEKYVSKQRFHIDHCHETGRVRGLLCSKCNKGLGLFKDNANFLREAAKYIEDNK